MCLILVALALYHGSFACVLQRESTGPAWGEMYGCVTTLYLHDYKHTCTKLYI